MKEIDSFADMISLNLDPGFRLNWHFFSFYGTILGLMAFWIRIRNPLTQLNPDSIRIRVQNT
jgi:hypothetical protein